MIYTGKHCKETYYYFIAYLHDSMSSKNFYRKTPSHLYKCLGVIYGGNNESAVVLRTRNSICLVDPSRPCVIRKQISWRCLDLVFMTKAVRKMQT
jgi:hypothetical protein